MPKSVNSAFSTTASLKRQPPPFAEAESQPLTAAEVQQILIDLEAADEQVCVTALRRLLPCQLPWALFEPLRQALKQLQKNASPNVRILALQVEQDAEKLATLEALRNLRPEDDEEEEDEWKQRERKRNKPRHRRRGDNDE